MMPSPAAAPVLVTGGAGFVGSHLVERLISAGLRVRCLVRQTSSLAYLPPEAELAYGDLAAGKGLNEALCGVRVVFHVAGATKARHARDYYMGNVQATENLLRAAENAHGIARFVHVSSLAAAGPSRDGNPLREDAPCLPVGDYGASKLAAEEAVKRSPLWERAVILRPPVVYGPRDTDVLNVFRAVRSGFMLHIGRGVSLFSAIYVRDLAEALLAASQVGPTSAVYFVANTHPVSWTQFAKLAADQMGVRLRHISVPYAAAYGIGWAAEAAAALRGKPGILSREKVSEAQHRFWTCDPARARRDLWFAPRVDLKEGIAETLNWYKMVGWLKA